MQSSKLVHKKTKTLFLLIQHLVSELSLLPASKTDRKWHKICKNQTIFEKRKYTYFAVRVLKHSKQVQKNTQKFFYASLIDSRLPYFSK